MNKDSKIAYFFYPGRKNRINSNDQSSKEFFYTFMELSNLYNTSLHEVETPNNIYRLFFKFYDKVIFKLTRLQTNSEKFCDFNYMKLFNSNNTLIFTNFALGVSAVPYLLILNIFKSRKVLVINSGLFSFRETNLTQKIFRNIYLKLFYLTVSKIIFTSKAEYLFATQNFKKLRAKFYLNEFCPDFKFWSKNLRISKKDGILFIGNDSSREFTLLEPIAKEFPDIEFTFISKEPILQKINLNNVKVVSGKWHSKDISDLEIKKYYEESRLTILPVKNNLVSSGQSVAMQSMSCKTPVMITDNIGFWNKEVFTHEKEILFVKTNELEEWVNSIKKYYYEDSLLEKIAISAFNVVSTKYNKETFDKKLLFLLDSN